MSMVPDSGNDLAILVHRVDDRPTCNRCHRVKGLRRVDVVLWFDGMLWGKTVRFDLCSDCEPEVKRQLESSRRHGDPTEDSPGT